MTVAYALLMTILTAAAAAAEPIVDLSEQFARARPLKPSEVRAMHYQRIDCGRRVFASDGRSIEGDANLKVTRITEDLFEVEFPSETRAPGADFSTEYTTAPSRRRSRSPPPP